MLVEQECPIDADDVVEVQDDQEKTQDKPEKAQPESAPEKRQDKRTTQREALKVRNSCSACGRVMSEYALRYSHPKTCKGTAPLVKKSVPEPPPPPPSPPPPLRQTAETDDETWTEVKPRRAKRPPREQPRTEAPTLVSLEPVDVWEGMRDLMARHQMQQRRAAVAPIDAAINRWQKRR